MESTGVCVSSCPEETYAEDGKCVRNCTVFPISYAGQCLSSCPSNLFAGYSGSIQTCLSCDASCSTCSSPSENACTSCFDGYFLNSNGYCVKCDPSCATCLTSATDCTSCVSDLFLLESSCVSSCPAAYFQDNVNRICSTCSPFLTTRPEGSSCCGSNCANCTVNGYCAVCESGFTISGGYCHQSGYTSRENYNYGLIKELLCHQPGEKSTMQTITALMGPDLTESDEATIYWMLFAKDIASDFETLTCDAIELLVSEDMNQEQLTGIFFNGKGRVAYSDSLYALVFSMDFQGLRANTKYNFTLCVKAATYANSTWS